MNQRLDYFKAIQSEINALAALGFAEITIIPEGGTFFLISISVDDILATCNHKKKWLL